MMKTKRIIACIISCILFMVCVPFTTTAKVIEPEVVKTEKWTTSYYIDDDIDTLYPYIQCEADIYNDGTIKLYMWNTHEWDGFATVSHTATIVQTSPVVQGSMIYCFGNGESYSENNYTYYASDQKFDVSYYSNKYKYSWSNAGFNSYSYDNWQYSYTDPYKTRQSCETVYKDAYTGALPEMPAYTARTNHPKYTFSPKEDPTGIYNFRLFGHDIIITPELLSGNIVATPSDDGYKTITYNNGSSTSKIKTDTDVSDIQEYIDKLEAENKNLKEQLANTEEIANEYANRLNALTTNSSTNDINKDGVFSIDDVQYLLMYYTESVVAKSTTDTIDVWYVNRFGKE